MIEFLEYFEILDGIIQIEDIVDTICLISVTRNVLKHGMI